LPQLTFFRAGNHGIEQHARRHRRHHAEQANCHAHHRYDQEVASIAAKAKFKHFHDIDHCGTEGTVEHEGEGQQLGRHLRRHRVHAALLRIIQGVTTWCLQQCHRFTARLDETQ